MRTLAKRATELLITRRWPLLILAIAVGLFAFWPARKLDFNRSIESVFAPDDPLLDVYRKLKRTFGGNEIVVAVYVDDGLFAPDGTGIDQLAEVSRRLAAVRGVDSTLSLDQPIGRAVADPDNPYALRTRDLLQGYTHGADGQTAAVVCLLVPQSETRVPRDQTVSEIRAIMAEYPQGQITGEPVMVVDGFRYVEEDGRRLGWATTGLLSLVILISFGSVRWVVIAIAVVQLAIILTRALIVWTGLKLTMVSSMFAAIVTVIGIASVVHIIVRYREGRDLGLEPQAALSRAGTRLAAPIFWAVATDAAGFLALTVSRIGPVQDFGLMMAIGAVMVLVGIALVVPGAALAGRVGAGPQPMLAEKRLDAGLAHLVGWTQNRPALIGLLVLLLVGVSFVGVFFVEIETDFTKNFRSAAPIVRAYQYVESNLGGAGVWDVLIPAPPDPDWPLLRRVLRLEERLRSEVTVPGPDGQNQPGLTKVFSLADVVVAMSPVSLDNIPVSRAQNTALTRAIEELGKRMPNLVRVLYGRDQGEPGRHCLRIMLRAKERQPATNKRRVIQQVERIVGQEFPPQGNSNGAQVGGYFVLLTHLVDSVLRDQWLTFAAATAGISLMMWLAFRSLRLALVALVPNALPILAVTGLLGWLGLVKGDVRINMGAAMIAAVSIGLSIDSSIHYITAFKYARREGKSVPEAIATVQQAVGRAVVFSTAALIVGFGALSTSQFIPTIYFGVLVSLAMLGGLAGNLILLPLLLRWIVRD